MESFTRQMFDAASVPASSSIASTPFDVRNYRPRLRPVIEASGADITVKLETSVDEGATWHELAEYAAGAVGPQVVVELPGRLVRLSAANAHVTNAQSVSAWLVAETD